MSKPERVAVLVGAVAGSLYLAKVAKQNAAALGLPAGAVSILSIIITALG